MNGLVVWFTGLSGSGKSTLATALADRLTEGGATVSMLDGDRVRAEGGGPGGFSRAEIIENGRRVVGMCERERESNDFVLVSVITPRETVREEARRRLKPRYLEVYVSTSVEVCRRRDTKGLYAREMRGELDDLIGVAESSPFEPPAEPDLVLDTEVATVEEAVARILSALALFG